MADRQFAISGKWALAADRLQWMVQRQYLHRGEIKWQSVSFVSSTKDILARCMREKGCPPADAVRRPAVYLRGMDPETRSDVRRDDFSRRVSPAYPEARRGPPHAANAL